MLEAIGAGGVIAISCYLGDGGGGDGGQQTIQFLTMGVGDNIQQFFEENNAQFEQEYDCNLEFTSVIWYNAQQTVNNRVDGGEAPDVARWPARWIPQLVGKEALVPITDMMEGDFGEKFYDGMAEGCMYQGSTTRRPGRPRTSFLLQQGRLRGGGPRPRGPAARHLGRHAVGRPDDHV